MKIRDIIIPNWVYDFFLILVGGLPLGYLIYRRIFYVRTPKNIIWENITWVQGFFYFFLFMLFLGLLCYICWKKWFKNTKIEIKPGF